jgi:3-ketosteroid 9alpha-monooxygenase subunit A
MSVAFEQATYAGWHLVAFDDELPDEVNPLALGEHRLVAVRQASQVRVFDATCPHRGAHLGYGGRLDRECLVCPFHGRRIHLGSEGAGEYRVAEHPALLVGQALFVRFRSGPDRGFDPMLTDLLTTHDVFTGFTIALHVASDIVIENAFDAEHFAFVHGMVRAPQMAPEQGPDGELTVTTALPIPIRRPGETDSLVGIYPLPFYARAYSPSLVVTRLGPGESAPFYFTGTTPTETGCIARVAVAAPKDEAGSPASPARVAQLISESQEAFSEDVPVWNRLASGHVPLHDSRDSSVLAFRDFVAGFRR